MLPHITSEGVSLCEDIERYHGKHNFLGYV